MKHLEMLARIVGWAGREDNIRAVTLTGSAARGPEALDDLSDLDVELYVKDPARLLDDDSWYSQFGQVLAVEALSNQDWHPTRLVYLVDGKIDFAIAADTALKETTYTTPFQVLVDKDGYAASIVTRSPNATSPPDAAEFLRCANWFSAAALMCAKSIVRDEPWMAKVRDWDLKRHLLRMIEWDHHARHGWTYDTGYDGKHINRWADREVQDAIDHCWSGIATSDMADALVASLDLFEILCARTAKACGLRPFDVAGVRAEVIRILALDAGDPYGPLKDDAWREIAEINARLERGDIREADWYAEIARLIVPAYLAAPTPWEGSGKKGSNEDWEYARSLIAQAIDRDGSFLDVGCANGLLLECLPRWSTHQLERFGLDIAPELVDVAGKRQPELAGHLFVGNALQWQAPRRFTFIRTGLEYVPNRRRRDLVERLLGWCDRLIIGVFSEAALARPTEKLLRSWGFAIAGRSERANLKKPGIDYRVLWIDSKTATK